MIKIFHLCSCNPKGIYFIFGKCAVAEDLECDFPSSFTIDL